MPLYFLFQLIYNSLEVLFDFNFISFSPSTTFGYLNFSEYWLVFHFYELFVVQFICSLLDNLLLIS
jgi:hypothetical protein